MPPNATAITLFIGFVGLIFTAWRMHYIRLNAIRPDRPVTPKISVEITAKRTELPSFYKISLTFRNVEPVDWTLVSIELTEPEDATFALWEVYERVMEKSPVTGIFDGAETRRIDFSSFSSEQSRYPQKTVHGLRIPAAPSLREYSVMSCELGAGEWIAASAAGTIQSNIAITVTVLRLSETRVKRKIPIEIGAVEFTDRT